MDLFSFKFVLVSILFTTQFASGFDLIEIARNIIQNKFGFPFLHKIPLLDFEDVGEFDISKYMKEITAADLLGAAHRLTSLSLRESRGLGDVTKVNKIREIFSIGADALKCHMDAEFCNAPPKTTKWSLCLLCLVMHSYAKTDDGLLIDFKHNNLELFLKARKLSIDGMNFLPKIIFTSFENLTTINLWQFDLHVIDENFIPSNANNLSILIIKSSVIRHISANAFKSAKNLEHLWMPNNQINEFDWRTFSGLEFLIILNLASNRIKIIHKYLFDDLTRLQELDLDENMIESFVSGTFRNQTNLKILSAQQNNIDSIDQFTFSGLHKLEVLRLNVNRITKINARTFNEMSNLGTLSLNHNRIKTIHSLAFKGCSKLHTIFLRNNQIKMLPGDTIFELLNLKVLNLHRNTCVNKDFDELKEAIKYLQMNCDPKPNNCSVPKIMNGWITTAQSQINVTVGNKFDYEIELAEVHCEPGYSLLLEKTMDNLVACVETNDGNSSSWNKEFLQCQKLCSISELMGRTARTTSCQIDGGETYDCRDKSRVGTKVAVLCKPGYELPKYVEVSKEFTCLNDGHWDHKLFDCIPICGKSTPRAQTFIVSGIKSDVTEYPWNVAVYRNQQNNTAHELICGGTILSERLVISAAHCFYEDIIGGVQLNPIEYFKIVTGKFYNDFNAKETAPLQTFGLTNIFKPELYEGQFGNYNNDIALLVLNGIITFHPHIAPICLEFNLQSDQKFLKAGSQGKVAGWGLTTLNDQPSEVLKSITLPVVSLAQCKEETSDEFKPFITDDKLCAGTKDGAGVCKGDSGAGLVFSNNSESKTYYLWGIVSIGPQAMAGIGGCDLKFYSLYTNVQHHISFIQQALMDFPSN